MTDPDTMTNQELRDELARLINGPFTDESLRTLDNRGDHPIPNTLDAAAAAMPEGWTWARWGDGTWNAQRIYQATVLPRDTDMTIIEVIDTRDERLDRFRLAVKVRRATR